MQNVCQCPIPDPEFNPEGAKFCSSCGERLDYNARRRYNDQFKRPDPGGRKQVRTLTHK